MRETLIKIDLSSAPETQDVLHNRWHPDIPMVSTVKPGAEFRVECVDWTGGQISNDESANDVRGCQPDESPLPERPDRSRRR